MPGQRLWFTEDWYNLPEALRENGYFEEFEIDPDWDLTEVQEQIAVHGIAVWRFNQMGPRLNPQFNAQWI